MDALEHCIVLGVYHPRQCQVRKVRVLGAVLADYLAALGRVTGHALMI
jgi:hypothetical protein